MAQKTVKKAPKGAKRAKRRRPAITALIWIRRLVLAVIAILALAVSLYTVLDPPITPYMMAERARLGSIDHQWVPLEEVAPVMARAAVAAEDANFCVHWGFDMAAIRTAIAAGGNRGASTISQQTVKNVYLWQGRSWFRKAMEAVITPAVEAVWSKRRILEVYLNIAEFDAGVFGIEAAARHYFGKGPADLSATEASRLAAILPDPKGRSASRPSDFVRQRGRQIADGAATIRGDGRSACFES
ncbi:monofunctional biosynthetic peptidoglycan transglycosylase [Profundibacterium mesophilum]|uniref:Biosynthetic peptidoglycan transglycosylase n=1 Tax=Profundibacterium mesophilum KAUST100406-0324 TaxID=1037889 RepID=A0A921TBM8_9RHOB|nr:monofunctional biosynthetic peptidoglycan transglycosylase [Profundibacterium mesophilum]KAF0675915.1 monofunctional biosynthetic peptidoglycan transglycosylase [Profundibacterium mesophilum KAUST100406-0324]